MTDLIPRDAAIEEAFMDAVWAALKSDAPDLRKQQRILTAVRAIPAIDPAAIREAALREAADKLVHVGYPNTDDEADGPVAVILALIQKDNTND